jgi:CDP-diacylglycerol--serine O-phosphatidyltransferase
MNVPSSTGRFFRYLAPNLITGASMLFGLESLWASHQGDTALAAWMVIYAVLTDRLDGLVARAVKGTSDLGMQLDSFADFLNFGIAPAFLVLRYLSSRPDLPYAEGTWHIALFLVCSTWLLAAVFRLARYNIQSDDATPTKIFFGFPTTLAGGTLAIWFLVFLKYDVTVAPFGGARIFGDVQTPLWAWKYLPIAMLFGAYLMASRLPMLKMVVTKNKLISGTLFALLCLGYVCGFAMRYPDVVAWMPTVWGLVFLVWGQASASARALRPPPIFAKVDEQVRTRSQEDLDPED